MELLFFHTFSVFIDIVLSCLLLAYRQWVLSPIYLGALLTKQPCFVIPLTLCPFWIRILTQCQQAVWLQASPLIYLSVNFLIYIHIISIHLLSASNTRHYSWLGMFFHLSLKTWSNRSLIRFREPVYDLPHCSQLYTMYCCVDIKRLRGKYGQ